MRSINLFLAAALIAAPLSSASPAAAATTVYVAESFDSSASDWLTDWFDGDIGARNRITGIADGVSGSAINVAIPAGSHFGSAAHYQFEDQALSDPDELYYRYFLRLPEDFVNYGSGKIPGPAGLYSSSGRNFIKPSNANPGWSARMQFASPTTPFASNKTQLGFYVYHRDQPKSAGEYFAWDVSPGVVTHGQWSCIEGHVSMNTPGVRNGVLEGWVDERLAFYQDDFRFLGSGDAALGIKSFWFDTFYGGNDPAPDNLNFQFDELALSSERIGCGDVDTPRFTDTAGSVHVADIDRLAYSGITYGCNPPTNDRFCPNAAVTRGAMAAFLTRALKLPPSTTADPFTDDNDSIFQDPIERLAAAGITYGCNPPANDRFCPDRSVTRGQMAAFLTRALKLPPSTTADPFTDDNDSIFQDPIERLAAAGITRGCNPPTNDRFCPDSAVTRAQMATFLTRALKLPAEPDTPPTEPYAPTIPAGFDAAVPAGWSIQAVSDAQPEGARIYLEPGIHVLQTISPKKGQAFVGGAGAVLDGQNEFHTAVSGDVTGVTIDGIEFRNYRRAVSISSDNWTVSNIVASAMEQEAIYVTGAAGVRIIDNTLNSSNAVATTTFSAAIRLFNTSGALVDGNTINDTHGYGVWFTDGAANTTVTNNHIVDNGRAGIIHDRAYGSLIRGNTITGNGRLTTSTTWEGPGIMVFGPDAAVANNLVAGNNAGIVLFTHNSDIDGPNGLYIPSGVSVTGNTVISSGNTGVSNIKHSIISTTTSFEDNDYTNSTNGTHWVWNSEMDWASWQARGYDTTGSFTVK